MPPGDTGGLGTTQLCSTAPFAAYAFLPDRPNPALSCWSEVASAVLEIGICVASFTAVGSAIRMWRIGRRLRRLADDVLDLKGLDAADAIQDAALARGVISGLLAEMTCAAAITSVRNLFDCIEDVLSVKSVGYSNTDLDDIWDELAAGLDSSGQFLIDESGIDPGLDDPILEGWWLKNGGG